MKLIRFGERGAERPGVMLHGVRKDCSAHFADWNRAFFQGGGLADLAQLLAQAETELPSVPDTARWAAPIARPGQIMCIGLNYSDHAKESGMEVPAEPLIFGKASNTIGGPYDPVAIPRRSTQTDWEVELGVVLGQDVSYLPDEAAAAAAIAGYCVVNDLSERHFQLARGGQWIKGKSCPGFSPVGPYLVTADEIANPLDLTMQLWVNGELMQDGNSATMVFSPAHLVWYLSQFMLVEAGDLISTGTPPGVGLGMKPPRYLQAGDEVELTIAGLGTQRQRFV